MSDDSSHPDFWNTRYQAAQTPWDLGGIPAPLQRWIAAHPGAGARVLIPGCGYGYEVAAFAAAGYAVTAIDFSPPAVAEARRRLGPGLAACVQVADFFSSAIPGAPFDLIYERTFLCALPVTRRPEIVARTHALMHPGGRVVGIYFYGDKDDGPPYGLESAEAAALFDTRFALTCDVPVPPEESPPLFTGRERWQERTRRG